MNKSENGFVDRIDAAVAYVSTLTPRNPMDVSAIVSNHRIAVRVCKEIHDAILCWRIQDMDGVKMALDQAEEIILNDPKRMS